jgi:hypothetical protein
MNYLAAAERFLRLETDSAVACRSLAAWMQLVRREWYQVRVAGIDQGAVTQKVGEITHFGARVHLGMLQPEDVTAQTRSQCYIDGRLPRSVVIRAAQIIAALCAYQLAMLLGETS